MKWLIIYVMLSRVRSLDCLKTTGMSTEKAQARFRKIIEGVPPKIITEVFETHFRATVNRTKKFAKAARATLGWCTVKQAVVIYSGRNAEVRTACLRKIRQGKDSLPTENTPR